MKVVCGLPYRVCVAADKFKLAAISDSQLFGEGSES